MKRIWFVGASWQGHPAMAGVVLNQGSAVDVPEDLAERLVASGDFVDRPPELSMPTVTAVQSFSEIMTQSPRPKSLIEIAGIGAVTLDRLDAHGIKTVEDLANIQEDVLHEIAEHEPGISKSLLRRWRLLAQ